jgi:hypothetical protein
MGPEKTHCSSALKPAISPSLLYLAFYLGYEHRILISELVQGMLSGALQAWCRLSVLEVYK